MRALVVYETLWGNTGEIARSIADGIRTQQGVDDVQLVEAATAAEELPKSVDLLVVGGPTHAFSMSKASTRDSARQQGAKSVPERGIREWIDGLTTPPSPVMVATFDTRTVAPRLPGSAAKKAMKKLVGRGFRPAVKPESFGVHGYSGPVANGELERAREWGAALTAT